MTLRHLRGPAAPHSIAVLRHTVPTADMRPEQHRPVGLMSSFKQLIAQYRLRITSAFLPENTLVLVSACYRLARAAIDTGPGGCGIGVEQNAAPRRRWSLRRRCPRRCCSAARTPPGNQSVGDRWNCHSRSRSLPPDRRVAHDLETIVGNPIRAHSTAGVTTRHRGPRRSGRAPQAARSGRGSRRRDHRRARPRTSHRHRVLNHGLRMACVGAQIRGPSAICDPRATARSERHRNSRASRTIAMLFLETAEISG